MRRVVAVFIEGNAFLGRWSVCVRYCVLLIDVAIECGGGIVRACDGVNDDVAIK